MPGGWAPTPPPAAGTTRDRDRRPGDPASPVDQKGVVGEP
ncbi:hypothetical protein GJR88_03443 [Dietzia sp. DQ12-45-1b]|nr:hypothetical protein GJR88_03443 [Dietzia sp. DQ12-45-1b]